MKTILVDAMNTFVVRGQGIFEPLRDLLEAYPYRKIILTGANDEQMTVFGLDRMPYEVFTLKHNPEKSDPRYYKAMLQHFGMQPNEVVYFEHDAAAVESARSVGIATHHYDKDRKDLAALKRFLDESLSRRCASARSRVSSRDTVPMQKKIVLASSSPRRRELLAQTGLSFDVVETDYHEDMNLALPPTELAMHLARGKAESAAKLNTVALIIAADTLIAFEGRVFGKPKSAENALDMLERLSGHTHSVITGFVVLDAESGRSVSRAVQTRVTFRLLSSLEIERYVATGEPLDRAGAYAIQGGARDFVARIEGDYDNVVGLPVADVVETLATFGVLPPGASVPNGAAD